MGYQDNPRPLVNEIRRDRKQREQAVLDAIADAPRITGERTSTALSFEALKHETGETSTGLFWLLRRLIEDNRVGRSVSGGPLGNGVFYVIKRGGVP